MARRTHPRLKINNQEVGLRDLGDGLFEPKNSHILQEVIHGNFKPNSKTNFYKINEPAKDEIKDVHEIQSFCFTTSINRISEAKILLKSLREYHSQPIFIHCDWFSQLVIERLGYKDLIINPVINEKYLKKIVEKHTKNKYDILEQIHHCRSDYIFAKLRCLKGAMMKFENTLFLDTDIIVLDNLQENFTNKICLSPAHFPKDIEHFGFEYGFYNAGYVFCADRGFPNFWINRFLEDSIFYEQECMNRFSEYYDIQTFDYSHNYGFWRSQNQPENPKSLHVHITDEIKKETKGETEKILFNNFRKKCLDIVEKKNPKLHFYINKLNDYKKYAFVHMAKCGGTYVKTYLNTVILNPCTEHIPEGKSKDNPHLEFRKDQVLKVIDEVDKTNLTENQWMRFHQNSVDLEVVEKLNDFGWETFTFLRDPRDIISSLYFFSKRRISKEEDGEKIGYTNFLAMAPWSGIAGHQESDQWELDKVDVRKVSLNDFAKELIENEKLHIFWQVPEYIDSIKHVDKMNHENLGKFINKVIDPQHVYAPMPIGENPSNNKGFKHYVNTGEISKEVVDLVEGCEKIKRYDKWL